MDPDIDYAGALAGMLPQAPPRRAPPKAAPEGLPLHEIVGKVPSGRDFIAPPPGLGPSWRDQFTPGLATAKGLIGGALEPFGQAGRLMTGQSQDVPGDLAGVLAAATPMGKLGKLAKPAAEAAEAATGGLGDFIKAYHGSPHDFERFDLSKIGTGEGAQAYGHGLYFAENEGVAKEYRNQLSKTDSTAQFYLNRNGGDTSKAVADWDAALRRSEVKPTALELEQQGKIRDQISKGGAGKMYQVAIKANPEHFLDWDKPLSEQHPKVIGAMHKAGWSMPEKVPTADEIANLRTKYGEWGQMQADALESTMKRPASEFVPKNFQDSAALREAGIPGIKYLDQGSRPDEMRIVDRSNITAKPSDEGPFFVHNLGKEVGGPFNDHSTAQKWLEANRPKQTRNFVVFDDKLIDILKKYSIAGIGALPAMNAFHYQDNSK